MVSFEGHMRHFVLNVLRLEHHNSVRSVCQMKMLLISSLAFLLYVSGEVRQQKRNLHPDVTRYLCLLLFVTYVCQREVLTGRDEDKVQILPPSTCAATDIWEPSY